LHDGKDRGVTLDLAGLPTWSLILLVIASTVTAGVGIWRGIVARMNDRPMHITQSIVLGAGLAVAVAIAATVEYWARSQ
jgi:hypothetical protein